MKQVTVALTEDELDALDAWALAAHDGDREAAVEALLDEWLEDRG